MLSVVSTPIGNLRDITLRALEVLKDCDAIICEDTRVTGKLLMLLGLPKKELLSFHAFNEHQRLTSLIARLKSGSHFALVCDAGTPGISDPGFLLVREARSEGVPIAVVPGSSAFLAALSLSGLPSDRFLFLGFLPIKRGRKALLESLKTEEQTLVFYESPHRIAKTLTELAAVLQKQPERQVVVCRELTKIYEEVVRTTVEELPKAIPSIKAKGEFVIVLGGKEM